MVLPPAARARRPARRRADRARPRQGRSDLHPGPERRRLRRPVRGVRPSGHHRVPDQLAADGARGRARAGAGVAPDDGGRRVHLARGARVAAREARRRALVPARRGPGGRLHGAVDPL